MPPGLGSRGRSTWARDAIVLLISVAPALAQGQPDAGIPVADRLVQAKCAACHGATGAGNPALGAPNLTDHVWLYGGDLAAIEKTIRDGRGGVMPAWRARLSDTDARLVAAWVYAQSHAAEKR